MADIISLAKQKAEEAEVFTVVSDETPVDFEANKLKNIQCKQSTSTALRIIKDGKIGYAGTTVSSDEDLVKMALETAQFGTEAKFEFPASRKFADVKVYDSEAECMPIDDLVKLGQEIIKAVTEHTPDILCEGTVTRSVETVTINNSRGGKVEYRASGFHLYMGGTLIRDTDMLFVGDSISSCHPITDVKPVIAEIKWQLDMAKNTAEACNKKLPVIFTPHGVASGLIAPFMSAFSGKMVLQGASPLANKLGEKVLDDKFSLWDDSTIDYQPASRPCDEEGVPSQRTVLIEKGVISHFYYDLQTAGLAGTKSTGNGQRARGGLPSPAPTAFVIGEGNMPFAEMLAGIEEGLVIDQLMGAEQGNVLGGDFSGNVLLGYKVEKGKIVGRVKNTMVAGNVYQLFRDIAGLSKEARWVGSSLRTPYIYLRDVAVSCK